jgi:hypothetical protein
MSTIPVVAYLNNLVTPGTIPVTNGIAIFIGSQTTRAGVYGEVVNTAAIGSIYLSTAGKQYLKVANAKASTDWQVVTTTAAD